MKYKLLSDFIAWALPAKSDRIILRELCRDVDSRFSAKNIYKKYSRTIKKLQADYKKRRLRVVFLISDSSKWQYDSLYHEFDKDKDFEPLILIEPLDVLLKKESLNLDYKKILKSNFDFFKNQGFNVQYAFDVQKEKYIDLKKFNPDMVFYQQPYGIPKCHDTEKVSDFALCFLAAYGSCISNGKNEYIEPMYKEVLRYFVDNDYAKANLELHGCKKENIVVSGQSKSDAYLNPVNYSNQIWKTENKKRIIWAPHFSFSKNSTLKFGTFDLYYDFFLNYAKNHNEFEFIFKPHPELFRFIVKDGLMSKAVADDYFKRWGELSNAQVYEKGDYFDMFRTSDLLITDCNSFLFEYLPTLKPCVHLINKYSVGFNPFGQMITKGYYEAEDEREIEELIEKLLFKGNDVLFPIRQYTLAKITKNKTKNFSEIVFDEVRGVVECKKI